MYETRSYNPKVAIYQVYNKFALMHGGAVITATGVHFPCLNVSKGGGSSLSLLWRVRINIFPKALVDGAAVATSYLINWSRE